MSKQPPAKPQQQTGEEHGSIKRPQPRNVNAPDTARGSEEDTRGAARNRT